MCKSIVAVCMITLNFAQFKVLSVSSAVGIFRFIGILMVMMTASPSKREAPGSLLGIVRADAMPLDWRAVPASLGIFMAPWGAPSG